MAIILGNNLLLFHKDWNKIIGNNLFQFHKDWDKIIGNNLLQFTKIGIKRRENIFLPIREDWDKKKREYISSNS